MQEAWEPEPFDEDAEESEVALWYPQARQRDFLDVCGLGQVVDGGPLEAPKLGDWSVQGDRYVGFGGACFGGKTDGELGMCRYAMEHIPGISIGFFRRTLKDVRDSEGPEDRSFDIIGPLRGAVYNGTKHRWSLPNGSKMQFCGCEHEHDRYRYRGSQFDILIFDETTGFPWKIIDYLLTRNRATCEWPGFGRGFAFAVMSTNPGDIGHQWYKDLFIDSGPFDEVHDAQNANDQTCQVVFLPAKLEDNPIGVKRDPDYMAKLEKRDPVLAKAMRWGIWDIGSGLFFAQHWRRLLREEDGVTRHPHVIEPIEIDPTWHLFGSVDYGFHPRSSEEKPFVYGVYAYKPADGRPPYPGRHLFRVAELAAAHWDPDKQCLEIAELEAKFPQKIRRRQGCPSMFIKKSETGPTIADEYAAHGLPVVPSVTDRANGWARCLLWLGDNPEDGYPHFMSFDTCPHFNKQIPALPVDDHDPLIVHTDAEDHAAEEWRHMVMSRPHPGALPEETIPGDSSAGMKARMRARRR